MKIKMSRKWNQETKNTNTIRTIRKCWWICVNNKKKTLFLWHSLTNLPSQYIEKWATNSNSTFLIHANKHFNLKKIINTIHKCFLTNRKFQSCSFPPCIFHPHSILKGLFQATIIILIYLIMHYTLFLIRKLMLYFL